MGGLEWGVIASPVEFRTGTDAPMPGPITSLKMYISPWLRSLSQKSAGRMACTLWGDAVRGVEIGGDPLGAPAYYPRALLSVWLFGFVAGISFSRKLEVACRDQIP